MGSTSSGSMRSSAGCRHSAGIALYSALTGVCYRGATAVVIDVEAVSYLVVH